MATCGQICGEPRRGRPTDHGQIACCSWEPRRQISAGEDVQIVGTMRAWICTSPVRLAGPDRGDNMTRADPATDESHRGIRPVPPRRPTALVEQTSPTHLWDLRAPEAAAIQRSGEARSEPIGRKFRTRAKRRKQAPN